MPWYKEAWHWAEAHPYASGGIVAGVAVVGYLLFFSGGSSGAAPTAGLTGDQAYQLQLAALQVPVQEAQAAASAQIDPAEAAAQAALGESQAQYGAQTSIATIAGQVANKQTAAQVAETKNTNQSNISLASIAASAGEYANLLALQESQGNASIAASANEYDTLIAGQENVAATEAQAQTSNTLINALVNKS